MTGTSWGERAKPADWTDRVGTSGEIQARAIVEEREAAAARVLRPRCYWMGCPGTPRRFNPFCSDEHAAAFEALPPAEQHPSIYAPKRAAAIREATTWRDR